MTRGPMDGAKSGSGGRHRESQGTGGMFSDIYRCHEQDEFDRALSSGLVWFTPDGGELRMRALCASTQDMAFGDVQRFDFEGTGEFRSWLEGMCEQSMAKAADATITYHMRREP